MRLWRRRRCNGRLIMAKAYKITVLVVDLEGTGKEEIRHLIENNRYIYPCVKEIQEADIGEWHDDHPLNKRGCDYEKYFDK